MWSKPSSERQILHNLSYKWNLINQTNWQAKYSQRHWNRQQTGSNQRGGKREIINGTSSKSHLGKKGKGHKWTWMRDPWMEPSGGGIESGRCAWVGQGRCWKMVTTIFEHQLKKVKKINKQYCLMEKKLVMFYIFVSLGCVYL